MWRALLISILALGACDIRSKVPGYDLTDRKKIKARDGLRLAPTEELVAKRAQASEEERALLTDLTDRAARGPDVKPIEVFDDITLKRIEKLRARAAALKGVGLPDERIAALKARAARLKARER